MARAYLKQRSNNMSIFKSIGTITTSATEVITKTCDITVKGLDTVDNLVTATNIMSETFLIEQRIEQKQALELLEA